MLFLARGDMPLTAVWEPWYRSVAGLVPLQVSRPTTAALSGYPESCGPHTRLLLQDVVGQACGGMNTPTSIASPCSFNPQAPLLQQQALFTVYVHSSRANFSDFPPGHLFAGTLIPEVCRELPAQESKPICMQQLLNLGAACR